MKRALLAVLLAACSTTATGSSGGTSGSSGASGTTGSSGDTPPPPPDGQGCFRLFTSNASCQSQLDALCCDAARACDGNFDCRSLAFCHESCARSGDPSFCSSSCDKSRGRGGADYDVLAACVSGHLGPDCQLQ